MFHLYSCPHATSICVDSTLGLGMSRLNPLNLTTNQKRLSLDKYDSRDLCSDSKSLSHHGDNKIFDSCYDTREHSKVRFFHKFEPLGGMGRDGSLEQVRTFRVLEDDFYVPKH
jgi:hypothetical protein